MAFRECKNPCYFTPKKGEGKGEKGGGGSR